MNKYLALAGVITIPPQLKTSKAGKDYCEMTIMDTHQKYQSAIAFGDNAKAISQLCMMGTKATFSGEMKDNKFIVRSFSIEGIKSPELPRNNKPEEPTPTAVELLMDKLGPAYVSRRIREFLGITENDISNVVNKKFDKKGYKKLIDELWEEAGEL